MSEASTQAPASSAPIEWKYDVFVSFRGEDARKGFISHFFRALELAEIRCYRDIDWDQRGRVVGPMLLDAIRTSRIALILFSTRYADSRWCLDEAVEIMNCDGVYRDHGHMVVPIFYDVEPSEVRRQSGEFGRGFESRAAEQGEAKVASWRAALEEAGNRSGWHLMNDANGDESELIEKIVGQIFSQTSFTNSPYYIKDAVGRDENASAVISLLDTGSSDDVRMIGLYGIKGIGKTTLAKLVCSRIYFKFEGVSFLENIGNAKQEGIVEFQKTLLNDVSKVRRSSLHDRDYSSNVTLIRDRLCKKKILLVLDNVEEKIQVTLLGGRGGGGGSLGPGSRVLMTTRNEALLDQLRVEGKFNVSALGQDESFQLFSRYAFYEDDEEDGSEELSRNLIHYTGGLPSAIKTLGALLFERGKDPWAELLEHLVRNPNLDWMEAYLANWDSFLRPYESKVEPYGGVGGSSYDDKGYMGIRQMKIVVVGGMIGSICIDYDHNGSLVRSSWHGGPHESQAFTVTLDYPDEFVTSISGYITDNSRTGTIQSLLIQSNRRTYGPFGDENGHPFSLQQEVENKGGKIIGFFGKCGTYLNSIGAYFSPVSHPYPFKNIGPFGHQDGDLWDDGKHGDIRQIDVISGSEVESISVVYDNCGHATVPFTHGEHGRGELRSVRLAYPYEYLTCISGYLGERLGKPTLRSISLYSNTKKYGPFGEEVGMAFSGPSTGSKIVGFHGSCSGRLESIGAYLEPVSHVHPMRHIGPFGGNGGSPWDDGKHSGIRKIVVRCGLIIDSIRFVYDDDDGRSSDAPKHGGPSGEHLRTVELDWPNEYLISISGYMGQWGSMYLINSLKFQSNRRVYGPYGAEVGTYFSSVSNIGKIVGFYGGSGLYLDHIGAYFAPVFHSDPAKILGPYGGPGGRPWDDGKYMDVRQIFLSYGTVIDGICCTYVRGRKSTHHGGHGGCSDTIILDYPDEYLISMSGYTGDFLGIEVVTSLTFQSNKRMFGPFGTNGETPFSFVLSSGRIVGFYGKSERYLNSIGVHLDLSQCD